MTQNCSEYELCKLTFDNCQPLEHQTSGPSLLRRSGGRVVHPVAAHSNAWTGATEEERVAALQQRTDYYLTRTFQDRKHGKHTSSGRSIMIYRTEHAPMEWIIFIILRYQQKCNSVATDSMEARQRKLQKRAAAAVAAAHRVSMSIFRGDVHAGTLLLLIHNIDFLKAAAEVTAAGQQDITNSSRRANAGGSSNSSRGGRASPTRAATSVGATGHHHQQGQH